jgi:hypothetical protein
MSNNILKWIIGNKKLRKRAFKTATEYANKVKPLVQTIQAELGFTALRR